MELIRQRPGQEPCGEPTTMRHAIRKVLAQPDASRGQWTIRMYAGPTYTGPAINELAELPDFPG